MAFTLAQSRATRPVLFAAVAIFTIRNEFAQGFGYGWLANFPLGWALRINDVRSGLPWTESLMKNGNYPNYAFMGTSHSALKLLYD
jgi:hypothetical protein